MYLNERATFCALQHEPHMQELAGFDDDCQTFVIRSAKSVPDIIDLGRHRPHAEKLAMLARYQRLLEEIFASFARHQLYPWDFGLYNTALTEDDMTVFDFGGYVRVLNQSLLMEKNAECLERTLHLIRTRLGLKPHTNANERGWLHIEKCGVLGGRWLPTYHDWWWKVSE